MAEYTERDIMALERQGGYYSRHVNAMTGEKLHDKSDIAAELAWRDAKIDALAAHVERLRTACQIAFQTPLDEHYSKGVNVALCHAIESTAETSLARLKAECWKEAYMAGMEYGHHWTVEGGYVPGDEEAAEDYVADRQAEEGQ